MSCLSCWLQSTPSGHSSSWLFNTSVGFIQFSNLYTGFLRSDSQYFSVWFPPCHLWTKVKGNKSVQKEHCLWWLATKLQICCSDMLILHRMCTLLTSGGRIWYWEIEKIFSLPCRRRSWNFNMFFFFFPEDNKCNISSRIYSTLSIFEI